MMKSTIAILILVVSSMAMNLSCGINNSPVESVPLIATVTVGAMAITRTDETKDLWTEDFVVQFAMTEDGGGGNDDGHGDDHGGGKIVVLNEIGGDTVIDGMRISLNVSAGRHMLMRMNDGWMEHAPDDGEEHVMIHLTDARGDEHDDDPPEESHPDIFESDVSLTVHLGEAQVAEIPLEPIWGHSGFYYGGHLSLTDLDSYDITVTVGAPSFARGHGADDKWFDTAEHVVTFNHTGHLEHEEIIGTFVISDEREVIISVSDPETLWHLEHGEWEEQAPDALASHHVMVTVRDQSSDYHAKAIGYTHVTVGWGITDAHPVTKTVCGAMFDDNGFHYGANVIVTPDGGDGDDDDDDDHGGDHGGG